MVANVLENNFPTSETHNPHQSPVSIKSHQDQIYNTDPKMITHIYASSVWTVASACTIFSFFQLCPHPLSKAHASRHLLRLSGLSYLFMSLFRSQGSTLWTYLLCTLHRRTHQATRHLLPGLSSSFARNYHLS